MHEPFDISESVAARSYEPKLLRNHSQITVIPKMWAKHITDSVMNKCTIYSSYLPQAATLWDRDRVDLT